MLLYELTKEELLTLDKELLVRMLMTQNAYVAAQQQAMQAGLSQTTDALLALTENLQSSRAPSVEAYSALLAEIDDRVLSTAGALH